MVYNNHCNVNVGDEKPTHYEKQQSSDLLKCGQWEVYEQCLTYVSDSSLNNLSLEEIF